MSVESDTLSLLLPLGVLAYPVGELRLHYNPVPLREIRSDAGHYNMKFPSLSSSFKSLCMVSQPGFLHLLWGNLTRCTYKRSMQTDLAIRSSASIVLAQSKFRPPQTLSLS